MKTGMALRMFDQHAQLLHLGTLDIFGRQPLGLLQLRQQGHKKQALSPWHCGPGEAGKP